MQKMGVIKINPRLQPSKKKLEERRLHANELRRISRAKKKLEHQQSIKDILPKQEPLKTKRHLRFRRHPHKYVPMPSEDELDVTEQQIEKPMTTLYCPESVKEDDLPNVKKEPELYIEINIIKISRVVDAFYLPATKRCFRYKKKEYKINEESIYLLPTKSGAFMPTCYYREGSRDPTGFKNMNKGITGKAMSLLYMEQLYVSLLYAEDQKYNLFIVILSIGILIAYGIGIYYTFMHGGGIFKPSLPSGSGSAPEALIRLAWRF